MSKPADKTESRIIFQREPVAMLWPEIAPLLTAHWKEIGLYHDVPPDPDFAVYESCEYANLFHAFTIRDRGKLIGYSGFFCRRNAHYQSLLAAAQDVLYLDPDYRGRMVGFKFIKWCDEQLAEIGVDVITQHVKVSHNWGALLDRIGYAHTENIWSRRIVRN